MQSKITTLLKRKSNRIFRRLPHDTQSQVSEQALIIKARMSRSTPVAIYGLQRSGTNYLLQALLALNVNVINRIDPDRRNTKHKHFRWQDNKATIPPQIREQYGNETHATTLADLCKATKRPKDCRHIVIFKDREQWLASILNWGLKCEWFTSKKDALCHIKTFCYDYDAYLSQWRNYNAEQPGKVAVVRYEEIIQEFEKLKEQVRCIGIKFSENKFDGRIDEVPMSPRSRKRVVSIDDIRNSLNVQNY